MRQSRESQPEDDYSHVVSVDTAHRALWCAVIRQAWDDATGHGRGRVHWWDKSAARDWPHYMNFELVCDLAGLDPKAVEMAFKKPKRG